MTPRTATNIWYGELLGATWTPPARRRTYLSQVGAAIRLLRASRGAELIVTSEGRLGPPGVVLVAAALTLTRSRRLALMEFLPGTKRGLTGSAVRIAYRALLKRCCVFVQVMTADEATTYLDEYSLPAEIVHHVPYYYLDDRVKPWTGERGGVFSSGHQSCDWDTLMDAAEGQAWPLTIVCSREDAQRIGPRATSLGVTVLSNLGREEHDALLGQAQVCVICLTDTPVSAGHTRLMSALSLGTPSILTVTQGTTGYDQLASATVPSGDAPALREAVTDALLAPESLAEGFSSALERGREWTHSRYSERVRELLAASVS